MNTISGWLFLFVSTIASAASPPLSERSCTARPPMARGGPIIWCNGHHAPPILGDDSCGATPEAAMTEWLRVTAPVNGSGSLCGPCTIVNATVASCQFQTTKTFPCGSPDAQGGGLQFNSTVSSCPAGYEPNPNNDYQSCVDKRLKKDDAETERRGGAHNFRDPATGNILRVERPIGTVIATYGNYDAFGRPGLVDGVTYGWPAGGGIFPDSIVLAGTDTINLHWKNLAQVDHFTIGKSRYTFEYGPYGSLQGYQTPLLAMSWNERGQQGPTVMVVNVVAAPPPAPAAAPPATSAATLPGPQPQIGVTPITQKPGGSIFQIGTIAVGASMLYPPTSSLIDRMVNWVRGCFAASVTDEAADKCDKQYTLDLHNCEIRAALLASTKGQKADFLRACNASAGERNAACLSGKVIPPLAGVDFPF